MTQYLPLINHPQPYPDELLPAYVMRLAFENGYDPLRLFVQWFRATAGFTEQLKSYFHYHSEQVFTLLESLTNHDKAVFSRLTPHRFAKVLMPPGSQFKVDGFGNLLFPGHSGSHRIRHKQLCFCPCCLQEQRYCRLHWLFNPIVACPVHDCWLVDTCPNCSGSLTLEDVITGCCSACGADLCASQPAKLPSHDLVLEAQRCIYAWFYELPVPAHLGLPQASGQTLFRLLDGLNNALKTAGINWSLFYTPEGVDCPPFELGLGRSNLRLSLVQQGALYATALQGILDWPSGFFKLLEAYRQRPEAQHLNSLNAFGVLYALWLEKAWVHPDFEFVQEAFDTYLVTQHPPTRALVASLRFKRNPELLERMAYVDVRNATRLLNTSPPKIHRLVRDGILDVYPDVDPGRPGIFLYRNQLERVRHLREVGIPKRDVARELGLTVTIVDDLVAHRILRRTGQKRRKHAIVPVFLPEDVADLRARLAQRVHHHPVATSEQRMYLSEANFRNGKVGLSTADLIQRVLDGKLAAYHARPRCERLNELWFNPDDITQLTQQVKDENDWVSFLETASILGIGRTTLHRWIASGRLVVIASYARAQYFSRTAVMQLCQQLVSSREARQILQVTQKATFCRWVKGGYLQALSGPGIDQHSHYIFDRTYLEAWHALYVSTLEAKVILKASDTMLRHWRKTGKLHRLVEGRAVPSFYHREEVMQLRDELNHRSVQKL